MINTINKNKMGSLAMIIGSINYALYPVIISIAAFSDFTKAADNSTKFLWGFVLVGVKELFNLFFQLTYLIIKAGWEQKGVFNKIKHSSRALFDIYRNIFRYRLNNKYGWLIVFAAFLAGPMGYSIETIGVLFAGPSVGTLLISLLPIFIMLFTKIAFKEKRITALSVALAIAISVIVLSNGIGQYISSENNKGNIGIGLICGFLTGIFWALENIIMSFVSKAQKMDHNEVIVIKLSSSAILVPLVLIPIVAPMTKNIEVGYDWYSNIFTTSEWIGWVFLVGFVMFLARWLYFYSIKNSTSIVSSMTLVIRFAWIPILQVVLFPLVDKSLGDTDWAIFIPLSIAAWALTLMLVIHEYKIGKGTVYKTNIEAFKDIFKTKKQR